MSTAKEIAALNDAMCVADVALENLDGGLQPTPYQRSLIALAAEVRRLREENERQRFDILAMNQSLDLMREENERLRKVMEKHKGDAEVGAFWIRYPGLRIHAVCDEISRAVVYRVTGSIFTEFFNTPQEAIFAAIDAARGGSSQAQNTQAQNGGVE